MGALIGLVAWLLAVVTEPLRGCTDLGVVADVTTFVACTARQG